MRPRTHSVWAGRLLAALLLAWPGGTTAFGEVLHVPQTTTPDSPSTAQVLVTGQWGSAPGEFGKVDEASRPGPMDFAIRGDALYVLDPVNARVQVFGLDGSFRRTIPIGTKTADFLCVDENGNVSVLDAFVRREFKTFSADGVLLTHAALPASLGLPSAIFATGDRVWIEERHNRVFEVAAQRGEPGAPARIVGTLSGRPTGNDRSVVHASKRGPHEVALRCTESSGTDQPATLRFPRAVAAIVALESDDAGRTYVATACLREPAASNWKTDIVLTVITPDGQLAGTIQIPNSYVTDHYRKLCVTSSGDIIQMQTSEEGVRFVRWTLPAHAGEEVSR